jgi:uncharacterized Zn finger protein (UPF0148 family)
MGKPRRLCRICDEPLADRWEFCPRCGQHYGSAEEQGEEAADCLRRRRDQEEDRRRMKKNKALDTLWCIYAALVIDGDTKKVRDMWTALDALDDRKPPHRPERRQPRKKAGRR